MPDSDTHLLDLFDRINKGDESAAEELVKHYYDTIRYVVRHQLKRNRELRRVCDSEDFTNMAFKSAIFDVREGRRFETREDFIAWLRGIARNKVKKEAEHYRAAKRDLRRQEPLGDHADTLTDAAPEPAQVLADREQAEHALGTLSVQDQEILRMRYQEQLSHRQIADRVGGDERSVARQLAQLLSQLAECEGAASFV